MPVILTKEQEDSLRHVLALTSSDSRFAEKAYEAIKGILSSDSSLTEAPVLNTVEPAQGTVGAINLKVKCKGSKFDTSCKIYMNNLVQATTFVSDKEIFMTISLVGASPGGRSIVVRNGAGAASESRTFTVVK